MLRKLYSRTFLLILFVIIVATVVRFVNFENRINFGPEQAISLIVAGDNIKEKFSLLGDENIQRTTSSGLIIFHAPLFNYSLIPLMIILNYDPVLITAYFSLLNILTGIVLFLVIKDLFNFKIAIFSSILFLFNSFMINHSLFIWGQNYIPLINIVIGLFLYQLIKKKTSTEIRDIFLIGLLSGFSIGLQFFYLFTMAVIFILSIYFTKRKLISTFFFSFGVILSLTPILLFDLKHDFYFLRTLYQYFLDTLQIPEQSKINYYHFLQFWPLLALLGGLILAKVYSKIPWLAVCLVLIYVYLNLVSSQISFTKAIGMNNLNYPKLVQASEFIALDKPLNFNVATTWDFDSQAHPLRYLMKYRFGLTPSGTENYHDINNLYVMSNANYDFKGTNLYEIASFRPFDVALMTKIDNDYSVFKLSQSK